MNVVQKKTIEPLTAQFVEACKKDDVGRVKILVANGFDLKRSVTIEMSSRNCRSERYPIDIAVRREAYKVMRFMVKGAGVDPNACIAPWGRFKPIQYAISKSVTETLLELGATFPESRIEPSSHPLFCALNFRPEDEELALFIAKHEKCKNFVRENECDITTLARKNRFLNLIEEVNGELTDEDEEML